jgi:SAM-dependent methyltransferase
MSQKSVASNEEWKKWGESDPLFGVASWAGRRCDGVSPWQAEEFYEVGRSDWEDFRAVWQRYGMAPEACLEIGCGAGRLTKHLCQDFEATHALDVSEGMVTYAKTNLDDPSVSFHISDGESIPLPDASLTAVFSTHVFQHFDSLDHARRYFREIARVLRPSGSMLVHLPIYVWPGQRFFPSIYAVHQGLQRVSIHFRRWLMRAGASGPCMNALRFPLGYVFDVLAARGILRRPGNHNPRQKQCSAPSAGARAQGRDLRSESACYLTKYCLDRLAG